MLTVQQVYDFINERAPFDTQLAFDNSGLLVGAPDREVTGVHFALDVTNQINTELKVPFGTYVKEVVKDSPAMLAGIQQGDVIVQMGGQSVQNFSEYITVLMQMEVGQNVDVVLMRQAQEAYKEMTLTITLGESGKE